MKVKITNIGEGDASCTIECTEEQFDFLLKVIEALDCNENNESYCPSLFVEEVKE